LPKTPGYKYKELSLDKWNVASFRAYMKDRHEELYEIPYVTNNYGMEGKMIKSMIDEYGREVVKRFIDECFKDYNPTKQYPGLNFAFMYSYMRSKILPRVLKDVEKEAKREKRKENGLNYEELADKL